MEEEKQSDKNNAQSADEDVETASTNPDIRSTGSGYPKSLGDDDDEQEEDKDVSKAGDNAANEDSYLLMMLPIKTLLILKLKNPVKKKWNHHNLHHHPPPHLHPKQLVPVPVFEKKWIKTK